MASTDSAVQPEPIVINQDAPPKKKPSLGKRILGLLWDSLDEKSPEEHRLVRRLDSCYLIWACFYYFVMYLDSSRCLHLDQLQLRWLILLVTVANINNAYVSGMKEDLNLYGNELNWMTTFWTIGRFTETLLDIRWHC